MSVEEQRENREEHRGKHKSSRREHKDRGGKRPRVVASFLSRFWFELLALGLLALGVFLLVEQLEIKVMMFRALMVCVGAVGHAVSDLWNLIVSVRKSNLVGITLILVATFMIIHRLRWRAIHRHQKLPLAKECPQCRGDLHRAERLLIDRLLELMLRVRIRHYSCGKCSFRASVWNVRGGE